MRVMGDNLDNLIEDSIEDELSWLRDEFDYLFRFKNNHYSKKDIELANNILDSITLKLSGTIDDKMVDLLSVTIESIIDTYPDLI